MQIGQQLENRVVAIRGCLAPTQSDVSNEQDEELPRTSCVKERGNAVQAQTKRNRPLTVKVRRQQGNSPQRVYSKNERGYLKRPETEIRQTDMMQFILSDNTYSTS